MFPNYYAEMFVEERQRERLNEVEQNRRAAQAVNHQKRGVRHLIGRSGAFLVMLGMWLEQVEQHDTALAATKAAPLSGHLHL